MQPMPKREILDDPDRSLLNKESEVISHCFNKINSN